MLGMKESVQHVETPVEYRRRIALLSVEMLFARTQVPCAIVDAVREIAECYGTEAAIVVSHAVLQAFEAGVAHRS